MAKGSAKKPKESKCRGSGAPLEGREWVRIGGNKWLREVAEKQGKHIPKEYAEKNGAEFEKERADRRASKDKAPMLAALDEVKADVDNIPEGEAPLDETHDSVAAALLEDSPITETTVEETAAEEAPSEESPAEAGEPEVAADPVEG